MSASHDDLVLRAERWLRNTCGCSAVVTELVAANVSGEIADAIGWRCDCSILIECKCSLSDFRRDQNKVFRMVPNQGLGEWRLYFVAEGLGEEIMRLGLLPEGWGLYEVRQRKVVHVGGAVFRKYSYNGVGEPPFKNEFSIKDERRLLVSALRRLSDGKAVRGRQGNGMAILLSSSSYGGQAESTENTKGE